VAEPDNCAAVSPPTVATVLTLAPPKTCVTASTASVRR
jgi:hypothetical protein